MRVHRWVSGLLPTGVLAVAAVFLGGCGYHLRGSAALPPWAQEVTVQAPSWQTQEEFRVQLESAGARVSDAPGTATTRLVVSDELFDQRVVSVDPRTGKAQEYEITYTLGVTALGPEGKVLMPRQQLRLTREYFYDANAVIGASREVAVLYDEMRKDAAYQALRRMAAAH